MLTDLKERLRALAHQKLEGNTEIAGVTLDYRRKAGP